MMTKMIVMMMIIRYDWLWLTGCYLMMIIEWSMWQNGRTMVVDGWSSMCIDWSVWNICGRYMLCNHGSMMDGMGENRSTMNCNRCYCLNEWCMNGTHDWRKFIWFADDRIKTVDGISRIIDCTPRTIRLDEWILSLDYITVTGFTLILIVAGKPVLDVIWETVLGMRVIIVSLWKNQQKTEI